MPKWKQNLTKTKIKLSAKLEEKLSAILEAIVEENFVAKVEYSERKIT